MSNQNTVNDFCCEQIVEAIHTTFNVLPEVSTKAYEDIETPEGTRRITHCTFVRRMRGRASDADKVCLLTKEMKRFIKKAWPKGSVLMWRSYPRVEEFDKAGSWFFDNDLPRPEGFPDDWYVQIRFRIGGFTPPTNQEGVCIEGQIIPSMEEEND